MVLKTKRILSLTLAIAMIATAPNQIPAQENDIKTQAVSPETVEKVLPEGFTGVTAEIKGAWNKIDEEVLANGNANYPADDGNKPTLKICPDENYTIPEEINEGETLQVMYDVDLLVGATSAKRVKAFKDYVDESNPHNTPSGGARLKKRPYLIGTEIWYKLDDATKWTKVPEKTQKRLGHYFMQIPADILFGHDQVTFKVRAYTYYGVSKSAANTVKINRLKNDTGKIRLNVNDGEVISGSKTVTVNDGKENNISVKLNNQKQNTKAMLENGAYFIVQTADTANGYKNAVTATSNGQKDILALLNPWRDSTMTKVIRVDNKYFKYNEQTKAYDVDLTLWAGNTGTSFEETLYPEVFSENRDDYKVSQLQMKLPNGSVYLPTKIVPDNSKINTSTELSAVHAIGDSKGMESKMTVSFSIPEKEVDAVGWLLDTTKLKDGKYTIVAQENQSSNNQTTTANTQDSNNQTTTVNAQESSQQATTANAQDSSEQANTANAQDSSQQTTTANIANSNDQSEEANSIPESTKVDFVVDNTKPTINIDIKDKATLNKQLVITEGDVAKDANGIDSVAVTLDGKDVELPGVISPDDLKEGSHQLAVVAKDVAGNITEKTVTFNVKNSAITSTTEKITNNTATLSVNVGSKKTNVTFYKGKALNVANNGIVKGQVVSGNNGKAPYEIFKVNTGSVKAQEKIVVNWSGKTTGTDSDHKLTMFVQNINTGKWKAIGEEKSGKITGKFVAKDYVKDDKATVAVQVIAKDGNLEIEQSEVTKVANQTSWDGTGKPENYDFAFAWETDTQIYAESFPYHYKNMNQWIVDNKKDWKIKYVLHTGDITDDYDMETQWKNADTAMKIFDDAGMPYGVLAGNHDVGAGLENYTNYQKYFGADRFKNKDYYGGSYKNNLGHYDLITENGQDFIILYMSWDIYTNEINWMNQVLKKYPNRKAIIALHRYTRGSEKANTPITDYAGKLIQTNVVAKNPNVIAVLNGHYSGASMNVMGFDDDKDGVKERTVYEICTDYQSNAQGGAEYVKLLYFDLKNNKIYVNSYSPYKKDFNYYDNPKLENYNQGTVVYKQDIVELNYNYVDKKQSLITNSINGFVETADAIKSVNGKTGKVSYTYSGLKADSEYSWYGKVTNSDGEEFYTKDNTFKTLKADKKQATVKIGKTYTVGKFKYKVKSTKKGITKVAISGKNKKIKKLVIPSFVKIKGKKCRITEINANGFKGYKKLKTIAIKSKYLTKIGTKAFYKCSNLKTVKYYKNKKIKVGRKAFAGCKKLKKKFPARAF